MRKGRVWTKVTADPICGLMNNSCINSHRDALAERRHAAGAQQGVACALVHADNHFSTSGLAEEEKKHPPPPPPPVRKRKLCALCGSLVQGSTLDDQLVVFGPTNKNEPLVHQSRIHRAVR